MSFTTGTQAELLYTLPSAVTKNTYTTQAAFPGVLGTNTVCSVSPGWLLNDSPNPVGRALYLKAMGTVANTAAATLAMALGLNPIAGAVTTPTPITVCAASTPLAATTTLWSVEAWFTCTTFATSTATYQINGSVRWGNAATGGAVVASDQTGDFQGTFANVDPRVQLYVELFGTWSVSNVANTTTVQQMFLWGLN